MRTHQDDRVIDHALSWGSSFEKAIARAAIIADADNLIKLRNAFPQIWLRHGAVHPLKRKKP